MTAKLPKVILSGLSDIGMVREENQDALLIHEPTDREVLRRKGVLVALADGMGGLEGGSMASKLAIDAVLETYYGDPSPPGASLEKAVKEANLAIYRHSRDVEGGRQMGSTMTALAIVGNKAFIAQVGDSRAYRYRRGAIQQVTRDHSLVRELMDRGEIDESSLIFSAHRNILTRGLGLREDVDPDVYEIEDLEKGETILLSSDGMHGLVHEDELAACLERFGTNLKKACEELVRVARERGGPDNITVALAYLEELGLPQKEEGDAEAATARRSRESRQGWSLPLAIFLSFAAGVFLTLIVERTSPSGDPSFDRLRQEVREALKDGEGMDGGDALKAARYRKGLEDIGALLQETDALRGDEGQRQ